MFDIFVGNFGRRNSIQNGQSQKAIQIHRLITDVLHESPRKVDSGNYWEYAASFVRAYMLGESVALCVGARGIRFAAILASLFAPFAMHRARVTIFVVGGWLPALATRTPSVVKLCRMSRVFVETQGLSDELRVLGISSLKFPNFRNLPVVNKRKTFDGSSVRLVYCGRINASKGAVRSIEMQQALRRLGSEASLDFYGPIEEDLIEGLINNSHGATYKGNFDDVSKTTEIYPNYDFIVLPSAYPGECVPGALVEAMFAGTPSIVSDWRFLPEVVQRSGVGLVFPLSDFAESAARRVSLLRSEEYSAMQEACFVEARNVYSVDAAVTALSSQGAP